MTKKIQMLILLCSAAGYLTLSLSNIFRNSLSDFTRGFLEGFSIVCILIGFIYVIWCIAKKKNPYSFQ